MRLHLFGFILLCSVAVPAVAQRNEPVDRRVERLEQEMRAVQRRVFPGGRNQTVEPEIQREIVESEPSVSGDALGNLVERVNALEGQLRTLTGQVEEQEFRSRQLEQELTRLRTEMQTRIERLEQNPQTQAAATPREVAEPATEEPAETPARPSAAASAADPAEEAYNVGFRLWNAGSFAQAATALEAAATRYPDSRWASWARNLHGRALLDDDKPAAAARVLLANYEGNPSGERAADSLYFLGQALTRLNRRTEACRVYDELERVYPQVRDFVRTRLPQARSAARCSAAGN